MSATVTTEGEPPGGARPAAVRAPPSSSGPSLSPSRFSGLGVPASDPGLCEPKFWDCLACHTREPVLPRSRRRTEPSATGLSVVGRAAAGGSKEELSLPPTPTPTLKSAPWALGGARTSSPPGGRVPAAPSAACTSRVPRVSLLSPPAAWAPILSQQQTPQRWESRRCPFALRSAPQTPGHPHPRLLWAPGILGGRLEGWGRSGDPSNVEVWGCEATSPELAFPQGTLHPLGRPGPGGAGRGQWRRGCLGL